MSESFSISRFRIKSVSPEEASMPTKPSGVGTIYVLTTVVEAVLVVVVEKIVVMVTLLVAV